MDQDDQKMLEALGILQIWALHKRTKPNIVSWSPVLERVASNEPAAKGVVEYMLKLFNIAESP